MDASWDGGVSCTIYGSSIFFKVEIPNLVYRCILDGDMLCLIFGYFDLDLWTSFYNNRVWSISSILFELGIPNLVCGYIFEW